VRDVGGVVSTPPIMATVGVGVVSLPSMTALLLDD
jgi:hypothetical protein